MHAKAKTHALYAALAAAAILAVACAWLARTAARQREELEERELQGLVGQVVRDVMVRLLLAETEEDGEEKGARDEIEFEGTPEEMRAKLQCFLEIIDTADRYGSDEALALMVPLLLGLGQDAGGFSKIPGGEEMVRKRLTVFRRALASDQAALKWFVTLLLMEIGDEASLASVGKSMSDVPGGKILGIAARAMAENEDEKEAAQDQVLKEIVGLLSDESALDRTIVLLLTTLIRKEGSERSLFQLLTSEDPADEREALRQFKEIAGEDVDIDLGELRSWIKKKTEEIKPEEEKKRKAKAKEREGAEPERAEPVEASFKVEISPPDDLPPAESHSYSRITYRLKKPVARKGNVSDTIIPMEIGDFLKEPPPWTFEFGPSLEPGRHLVRIVLDETYGCYVPFEVFPDGRVEPAEVKVKADRKIHECRIKCEINGPKSASAVEDRHLTTRYVKRIDGMEARIASGLRYSKLDGRAPWTIEDKVKLMTGEYHMKAEVARYYVGRASFRVLPDGRTEPSAVRITLRRKSRAR